jgi:hypothetical protein
MVHAKSRRSCWYRGHPRTWQNATALVFGIFCSTDVPRWILDQAIFMTPSWRGVRIRALVLVSTKAPSWKAARVESLSRNFVSTINSKSKTRALSVKWMRFCSQRFLPGNTIAIVDNSDKKVSGAASSSDKRLGRMIRGSREAGHRRCGGDAGLCPPILYDMPPLIAARFFLSLSCSNAIHDHAGSVVYV